MAAEATGGLCAAVHVLIQHAVKMIVRITGFKSPQNFGDCMC
jgi:hypothetical protein